MGRKAEWRVKRVTHIHCLVDSAHTHFDLSLRRLLVCASGFIVVCLDNRLGSA